MEMLLPRAAGAVTAGTSEMSRHRARCITVGLAKGHHVSEAGRGLNPTGEKTVGMLRNVIIGLFTAQLTLGTASSMAQTKWDLSTVWPEGNFHTKNAMR